MSRDVISELRIRRIDLERISTPARFRMYDLTVCIVEITRANYPDVEGSKPIYFVSLFFKYGNLRTRVFTIPCFDTFDFIDKLKKEILNFKKTLYILGEKEAKHVFQGSPL